MSGRSFLDTNVLVYCFDAGESAKQRRAQQIVEQSDDELVVSTQVLQEFYVTVVRKLARPLTEDEAEQAVRELAALPTIATDTPLVLAAIASSRQLHLSLWDALVLQAALAGGCTRLLSEDLQHGFQLEGVRVENPFLDLR